MPSAISKLRRLDATEACADAEAFTDAYPADGERCDRLWDVLEDSKSFLLAVTGPAFRRCCGEPVTGRRHEVVVSVDGMRSPGSREEFRFNGASAAEVHTLLKRRDRARRRLAEVEAGERDEDAAELQRVVETLDWRARAREDLDSSFEYVWLRASHIEVVFCHYERQRPQVRQGRLEV